MKGMIRMIKFENTQVTGWEAAIRGMRNPKNSWDRSDTSFYENDGGIHGACDHIDIPPSILLQVGNNDFDLMERLAKGGPVHAKYRRMIVVYVDITAPLYWWKEFDTYKVGTVANSCSTMHKIADKEFEESDFSCEHLDCKESCVDVAVADSFYNFGMTSMDLLKQKIGALNYWRDKYNSATDDKYKKHCWWQMIQLLPSSYNQKRTVMLNYEVLSNIIKHRQGHKLDEWRELCSWAEDLPYSEVFLT